MSTTSPIFALPAPELTDAANIEDAVVPLRDRLELVLNAFLPIGVELWWPGSALPTISGTTVEFQWADGALLTPRDTTYAAFLTAVGHAYNANVDPGSNSVRKPDKRGRFALGADNMGVGAAGRLTTSPKVRGASLLAEFVTLSASHLPAHNHEQGLMGVGPAAAAGQVGDNNDRPAVMQGNAQTGTRTSGANWTLNNTGGGGGHNNIPNNEVDNVIVRVR
jgi:hypothetical protein